MTGYFEELLERIRDIRASERLFYQKMMEQKAHQEFKTYTKNAATKLIKD
jgi:hypothetical protein